MRTAEASRLDCLVFLRVVATVAVVFGHSALFNQGATFTQWPRFPAVQSMAVTVFFAVSGWTIAWVLDTRRPSYGRFAYDRYMRLAIPLFPVLVALAVLELTHYRGAHPYPTNMSATHFVGNLAFLQDLRVNLPFGSVHGTGIEPYSLNRPLWTVSREFWIYLAFGGAVLAVRANRLLPLPLIGALVASVLLADNLFRGHGAGLGLVWLGGAALYRVQRGTPVLTGRHRLVLLPIQVFLLFCLFDESLWPRNGTYSLTWNMVLFANFACFMILAPGLRVPAAGLRVMAFLGSFAYTTYLVHYPLMYLAREQGVAPGRNSVVLMTVVSFVLAWCLSLLFERRYRTIRDALWNAGARLFARLRPVRREAARHGEREGVLAAGSDDRNA